MQKYFNVFLEFDHHLLKSTIEEAITNSQKGYVCVVDANVLTIAQKDEQFRNVLNGALINTCDGSSIAMLAGMVHKQRLRALNGPEIFAYYIEKKYKQLLLGSDEETSNQIKATLQKNGVDNSHLDVMPLPFEKVEDFNYAEIAEKINILKPEIIWVSLGAPKQELFIANLIPYLNSGILFAIGAAFNFYIGKIALPDANVGALKFIWISRIFSEPKKQLSRIMPYLKIIPRLYWQEKRKIRNRNK